MNPQELKSILSHGLLSFPVTDFNAQGDFHQAGYIKRLEWLAPYGASALFAAGGTGEFFSLAASEYSQVVKTAVDTCASSVPILAGVGGATRQAIEYAQEAERLGAKGLLLLPHYLTEASQDGVAAHVEAVCKSVKIGVVVYNRNVCRLTAPLLERLAERCPNLIGFKEFGGAADLRYAAENITSQDDDVTLMVGVDTQVVHGFVNCNATGAITGIGNALPREVLQLVALSKKAAKGDAKARRQARELEAALAVLSSFDEGCDLVLYYKHLMVLNGDQGYALHFNETDGLSAAQRRYAEQQYALFRQWYANWSAEQNVV